MNGAETTFGNQRTLTHNLCLAAGGGRRDGAANTTTTTTSSPPPHSRFTTGPLRRLPARPRPTTLPSL
ncbi:hypothetical protein E2C01_059553 [Portunus trituberculatus]|uniref:Uncharacterized protein n=1 Tax=Portunus trituberculatus TaxID=210409 RepID=A0A5B7GZH8_PORTR|nr:hypothetical protein [Portunus trituberculatus]